MPASRDFHYDPAANPFASHATRYNGNNALCLAAMANLAYEDEAVIGPQVSAWGFNRFKFFEKDGTEAFIAGDNDKIIVSFRGTEPEKLEDLLTDADLILIDRYGGQVHKGFEKGVERVWAGIRATINDFQDNTVRPQSLWFTGHSLGAALTSIAVARLRHDEDKPVYGQYTFGQPRTGDQNFAGNVNTDTMTATFRYVNNNDIVTRVPPRAMRYRHIGKLIYFSASGVATTDIGFWAQFLDRVKGRIDDLGRLGPDGLNDHDMSTYVKYVRANVNSALRWD